MTVRRLYFNGNRSLLSLLDTPSHPPPPCLLGKIAGIQPQNLPGSVFITIYKGDIFPRLGGQSHPRQFSGIHSIETYIHAYTVHVCTPTYIHICTHAYWYTVYISPVFLRRQKKMARFLLPLRAPFAISRLLGTLSVYSPVDEKS